MELPKYVKLYHSYTKLKYKHNPIVADIIYRVVEYTVLRDLKIDPSKFIEYVIKSILNSPSKDPFYYTSYGLFQEEFVRLRVYEKLGISFDVFMNKSMSEIYHTLDIVRNLEEQMAKMLEDGENTSEDQ